MTVIDTPAGINMWVLLSRRRQIQMHLRGLTVKGLAATLKREFPDVGGRYVKDFIVPVEFAISQAGGEVDYKLVNVHICEKLPNGLFQDMGIYPDLDTAGNQAGVKALWFAGRIECILTTEDVRDADGRLLQMG